MSAQAAEGDGIDLGDQRLNRQARRVLATRGDKPTVSIPAAGGWSETRAAYRLFDHDAASEPGDAHRPPEARKGGGEGQDTETQGGGQGGPDQV